MDVSSNKLSGVPPSCLESGSDRRVFRYGGNCLSADSQPQKKGSYCEESSSGRKKFWRWGIAAAVVVVVVVVVVFVVAFGVLFYRKKCDSKEIYRHEMLPKIVQDNSTTGVSSEILASASKYIDRIGNDVLLAVLILIGYMK